MTTARDEFETDGVADGDEARDADDIAGAEDSLIEGGTIEAYDVRFDEALLEEDVALDEGFCVDDCVSPEGGDTVSRNSIAEDELVAEEGVGLDEDAAVDEDVSIDEAGEEVAADEAVTWLEPLFAVSATEDDFEDLLFATLEDVELFCVLALVVLKTETLLLCSIVTGAVFPDALATDELPVGDWPEDMAE